MKNTLRVLSVLMMLVMTVSAFAACGGTTEQPTTPGTTAPKATTEATEASVPFVAPPDEIGLVISADEQLVTWQPYKTTEDSLDFTKINLKELGEAGEMALFYMEAEVTYYSLVSGKLEKATVEDVVTGSVIGITTLEEGVQEVYILSVPAEEDDSEEQEDTLEDIFEETEPAETTAPEEYVPEEDTSDDVDG